ncbi:MAG TPA: DUF2270 domain-containing protein [Steroidobacteraceae bacterium]|nr:DUF2270 domain-containing protein [Steroidobacteraceae bacterium]
MADTPETKSADPVGIPLPGTTTEVVTALAHYYRSEVTRMISWRDRLDRTTNWAIGALAAMLSISLATEEAHHSVLLFAMLLIHALLVIEARRYRFFHVYRARVRMLESEYFARMFSTQCADVRVQLDALAEDLRLPCFRVSLAQAMSRRLRRNYGWIFLVVLLAWLVKTTSMVSEGHTRFIHTIDEFLTNAAVAGIPGGIVVLGIVVLYGWLAFIAVRFELNEDELGPGQVHV